jgi:hypothetical protein
MVRDRATEGTNERAYPNRYRVPKTIGNTTNPKNNAAAHTMAQNNNDVPPIKAAMLRRACQSTRRRSPWYERPCWNECPVVTKP